MIFVIGLIIGILVGVAIGCYVLISIYANLVDSLYSEYSSIANKEMFFKDE